MAIRHLALYKFDACPYCRRVLDAIGRLGVDIELRDILTSAERRRELVEATGRQTVPCLRIEDDRGQVRWMHESLDIIAFLDRTSRAPAPS
jgi:glutaredoxin 2